MAMYHGEYIVSYGSASKGPINSWSSYETEKEAIEARLLNVKLGRFAEVYQWDDTLDDYKRIIDIDGERKSITNPL